MLQYNDSVTHGYFEHLLSPNTTPKHQFVITTEKNFRAIASGEQKHVLVNIELHLSSASWAYANTVKRNQAF